MSADNEIAILRTPRWPKKIENGSQNQPGYEYRVAHIGSSQWDEDQGPLVAALLFGGCTVFHDLDAARVNANQLFDMVSFVEYGINTYNMDFYFPNMTVNAARLALDCREGVEPLDCPVEKLPEWYQE